MLISVSELHAQLENPRWVVFDCRHDLGNHAEGLRLYEQGHLPGAFFAPVETALSGEKTGRNGRHPLPEPSAFAAFLETCGVTDESMIVAYDDVGGQYAARLWWMARWIGLERVAVLDGGLPKWLEAGLPVTTEVPPVSAQGRVVVRAHPDRLVSVDEVEEASQRGDSLILDARASARFRGEMEPLDRVAGHIPAARNRFFKDNLNGDLTMRPAGELREEFETLLEGAAPEKVIHQCGSGITACANLLAMEHAGLSGSRLYPGSWSEWCSDANRPVATGG